jgi:hypothetical protein
MRRIRTLGTAVAGLMALVVTLTGCLKIDMDMKVTKDAKLDGAVILGFSSKLLELSGQSKKEMIASIKKDWGDLPKGAKAEIYDKDGFIGQKITFKDMAAADFAKVTSSANATNPAAGEDSLTLVKEGGNWKFSGTMDMTGNLGLPTDTKAKDGSKNGDLSALMKGMKVKIKMSFPGSITKHDKDGKVSGNTITWEPKAGKKYVMLAIAKPS